MRSQERDEVASVTAWTFRVGTTVLITIGGLAGLSSPAWAVDATAPTNFGVLGPVGIVAVGVGVLGMIAGVARRRRQALARSVAERSAAAEQVVAERAARAAANETSGRQTVPGPSRPPAIENTAQQVTVHDTQLA